MNPRCGYFPVAIAVAVLVAPCMQAAKPASDIVPPEARRTVVDRAEKLAHPPGAAALPATLNTPFAPQDFARPDPSEAAEGRPQPGAAGAKAAPVTQSDRDLLATVASKIPTTGTIILRGKPLLISGMNRIEVGAHFTVVYGGQEYELELVAVDRTTFTVRYRGEEYTRPIKLAKSQ